MKKILLSFIALATGAAAYAQPVLSTANKYEAKASDFYSLPENQSISITKTALSGPSESGITPYLCSDKVCKAATKKTAESSAPVIKEEQKDSWTYVKRAPNKEGDLFLTGSIKTRYNHTNDNIITRALDPSETSLTNQYQDDLFRSQASLGLKYSVDNFTGITKLSFSKQAAAENSSVSAVLDTAWLEYNLPVGQTSNVSFALGKQPLGQLFDSQVQFAGTFNGAFTSLKTQTCVAQVTGKGGIFVINAKNNHFGYVGELQFDDIASISGLSLGYNYISWYKAGKTNFYGVPNEVIRDAAGNPILDAAGAQITTNPLVANNPFFAFGVSQISTSYSGVLPQSFCYSGNTIPFSIYGAFLINSRAPNVANIGNLTGLNKAWYAGISLGAAKKAKDLSFDICYQSVDLFSVPVFDLSGISHPKSSDDIINTALRKDLINNLQEDVVYTPPLTNYVGYSANFKYLISSSILFNLSIEVAKPKDDLRFANTNNAIGKTVEIYVNDFKYNGLEASVSYNF